MRWAFDAPFGSSLARRWAGEGMEVVRVENLTKVYGIGKTAVSALRGANLVAQAGELVAILGPSGSGKTTLLTSIAGIVEPTAGRVTVGGITIYDEGWKVRDRARFRREHLGFIFQAHNLIPFLTALENVRVALELRGVTGAPAARRARVLLEYLDVGDRQGKLPEQLSGGEQQRVAIARALANSPEVILADEPTAALDSERGRSVMALFRRIAREKGSAIVCVTHDRRMIEGFDHIHYVKDGRVSGEPGR
ncbi:MAG: ABC transporter ATP-binding protein [Myxococcales bacterium]